MSALRAPAWAWLLTACAVALFGTLGAWQLRRGFAKQAQLATLHDVAAPVERLTASSGAPTGLELRRAGATGRFVAERQLLQDGQSLERRPGYHVWTPLRLDDGALLLVNRGWIPLDRAGFDGSAPPGPVSVRGFFRSLPEPGVRLGEPPACARPTVFPAVVLYPTAGELTCLLGPGVLAGLLLLDADLPGGFARAWTDFGFPPERHFGYAVQWLGLAMAAVVLFYVVNRKRPP